MTPAEILAGLPGYRHGYATVPTETIERLARLADAGVVLVPAVASLEDLSDDERAALALLSPIRNPPVPDDDPFAWPTEGNPY